MRILICCVVGLSRLIGIEHIEYAGIGLWLEVVMWPRVIESGCWLSGYATVIVCSLWSRITGMDFDRFLL